MHNDEGASTLLRLNKISISVITIKSVKMKLLILSLDWGISFCFWWRNAYPYFTISIYSWVNSLVNMPSNMNYMQGCENLSVLHSRSEFLILE